MMRKTLLLTVAAAMAILLCACGAGGTDQKEPETEKEEQSSSAGSETNEDRDSAYGGSNTAAEEINAWGDSITEGYGSDGLTYPEVLEQLTGIPVRNLGVGGEDSTEILARCLAYGSQEEDILVMQMGDNGGWKDLDELIGQYRQMIESAGTDRYIIISSTDDPDDFVQIWGYTNEEIGLSDTWYEARFREAFGDHLLNGRKYLIEHGLEVNGLKETEEDAARAMKGNISLQFRNPQVDNTHLNEQGYTALAHGVFELGKKLGYW